MDLPDAVADKKKSGAMSKASIIGISLLVLIAGFCIPQIYSALQRGHQVQTAGDMKTIAMIIEDYREQYGFYPAAQDINGLMRMLVPEYLSRPITLDGWNHQLHYAATGPTRCQSQHVDKPAGCGPSHYTLTSAGADGLFEPPMPIHDLRRDNQQFACDIVLQDGQFTAIYLGRQEFGTCKSSWLKKR